MDANGTRYHLLLGRTDWAACSDARNVPLSADWDAGIVGESRSGLAFDSARNELTLSPQVFLFTGTSSDKGLAPEARRGAARDRYGNWYWIAAGGSEIRVQSAGSGATTRFWVPGDGLEPPSAPRLGDFQPRDEPPPPAAWLLSGLTVTEDHYLIAGVLDPAGLLVWDLHRGGPPQQMVWPRQVDFVPFDMAPAPGGGAWILDRAHRRYWSLDRRLNVVPCDQIERGLGPEQADDFQPRDGGPIRRATPRVFPTGITLNAASPVDAFDPIAIEALPDGTVLILDRHPDRNQPFSRLYRYRFGRQIGAALWIDAMRDLVEEDKRLGFGLIAHDLAFVPEKAGAEGEDRLYIAAANGNQAFAFHVGLDGDNLELEPRDTYLPMRLFGGKGLVAADGKVYYDFDDSWIPLVAQPRRRFESEATLFTPLAAPSSEGGLPSEGTVRPAFDGREPDCVWHRLMLDGCIPPETEVQVWSRAANAEPDLQVAEWQLEPRPYLRGDGSELPFVPKLAGPGDGTWELLFQQARGRFLQLQLRLSSNGRSTPRLRALRAYYPRFSYLDHYLPAVYRDESLPASFLDRFLANVEGFYTSIEDKIAAVQILFDVSSSPPETLDWLASWLAVALDPVWDERRRRLFIRHAMDFFQYRGTMRGVRMALRLALDACSSQAIFDDDTGGRSRPDGIRIVERYRTRRTPGVLAGDPTDQTGPRLVSLAGRWLPAQGRDALDQRYADFLRAPDQLAGPGSAFPIIAPSDATVQAKWEQFARNTLLFVPSFAAAETQAWQAFLAARYVDIGALNAAHGTSLTSFSMVALPGDMPTSGAPLKDWNEWTLAATTTEHRLWQDFLTRRYGRISALNDAYGRHWAGFASVSPPDQLPRDGPPLVDWYQFESVVLAMRRTAHRFTVLLPAPKTDAALDAAEHQRRLDLAQRVVDLEKPAHTIFDVKFYWAVFRTGEARLGQDTLIDRGSRAPQLMRPMVLGQGYLAATYLAPGHPQNVADRQILGRDRLGG